MIKWGSCRLALAASYHGVKCQEEGERWRGKYIRTALPLFQSILNIIIHRNTYPSEGPKGLTL